MIFWNEIFHLEKLPIEVKQIIRAEETDNPDKVMTCINKIPSTSNTLKNLLLNKSLHSPYIRTEFNEKKEIVIKIFSSYVESLLKYINHTELPQEWKLNLHAAAYKNKLMLKCLNLLIKNKFIIIISTDAGQPQ